MRKIHLSLIGIGTGNPDHLTLEAIKAMNAADMILLPNKGDEKSELLAVREAMCDAHIRNKNTVLARFDMPVRDPKIADYHERVDHWHDHIAEIWRDEIEAVPQAKHIAILVWGDPSLYDSTLRISARISRYFNLQMTVIAGITSIQGLTAAHQIPLNKINEPFMITTGRQLQNGWPEGANRIVVMLDGQCCFQQLDDKSQYYIHWSAYVGMAQEINIEGRLNKVASEIIETRQSARSENGWIMDIYLIKMCSS